LFFSLLSLGFSIQGLFTALDDKGWGDYYLQMLHIVSNEDSLYRYPAGLQYQRS
jgi:hypothetical protein